MTDIPDQIPVWDKKHSKGDHDKLRDVPSPLVELVEPKLPRNSEILELGTGVGRDAIFLARNGHTVTATDGSTVVIHKNKSYRKDPNIEFAVLDIRQPLPYDAESFDVVYANLSLHYYSDQKTREIFKEIARVLKRGGIFAFACKSQDEFRSMGAKRLDGNIIVAPNNQALHLFSTDYAEQLLEGLFKATYMDEVDEEYEGNRSSIIRCMAVKKDE